MWSLCCDLLVCPFILLLPGGGMSLRAPMQRPVAVRVVVACRCCLTGSWLPWDDAARLGALIQVAEARCKALHELAQPLLRFLI